MNSTIEIHDSRVAEICKCDGTVIVHFLPAYLHKSEGRPVFDAGTGWVQEARLIFTEASVEGDYPDWPCDIADGEIIVRAPFEPDARIHVMQRRRCKIYRHV